MANSSDSQAQAGSSFAAEQSRMGYQERRESQIGFDWNTALSDLRAEVPEYLWHRFWRELRHPDRDGWRYLLPALPRPVHVVCLEARFGCTAIALSEMYDRITVLHHAPGALALIRRRAEVTGVRDLATRMLERGRFRLPFDDASVDGFVYHDLSAAYPAQARLPSRDLAMLSPAVLGEIRRVLKPHGFVYLGLPNPLGASRRLLRSARGARPSSARKALNAAGFKSAGIHPYLEKQGSVSEVLPTQGYRSVKDSHAWRERLKELLFASLGARFLAPAYGYIGGVGPAADSALDRIAAEALGRVQPAAECLQKYLILAGKVIVTLDDRVVVMPRLRKMLESRRRDLANVSDLVHEGGPMRRYLPAGYREFTLNGETGFVMKVIPGVTFDSYSRALSGVTREAARLLADFHGVTAHTAVLTPERYALLCGWIVEQLANRYPVFASEADMLDRLLRARLLGRPFLATWMHGDYKLENLVLDRQTLAIEGVIDWEHARRQGLPLLDLYYLFAYNRWQSDMFAFFRSFPEWLPTGNFNIDESRMLDDYLTSVRVPVEARTSLVALFFLHHVAVRMELNMERRDFREGMDACLRALIGLLERDPVEEPRA